MARPWREEIFVDRFTCIVCNKEMKPNRKGMCPNCNEKAPYVTQNVCVVCGCTTNSETQYCFRCAGEKRTFERNYAPFEYRDSAKLLVHKLKFQNKRYLAKYLAAAMTDVFLSNKLQADCFVPTPMFEEHRIERGYNQSELLALELAKSLNIPTLTGVLIKTKQTPQQMTLSAELRKTNLLGAFSITDKAAVKGKRIFVIDDVMTTGSTMEECAKTLKKAGALSVSSMTFAVTPIVIVGETSSVDE